MGDEDWGSFRGFGGPGRGPSLVGLSGLLCKWEMRIGVVSRVKGDWKWFFFSGGCLVHCASPPSPPSPPTRVSSKKSIAILTC